MFTNRQRISIYQKVLLYGKSLLPTEKLACTKFFIIHKHLMDEKFYKYDRKYHLQNMFMVNENQPLSSGNIFLERFYIKDSI